MDFQTIAGEDGCIPLSNSICLIQIYKNSDEDSKILRGLCSATSTFSSLSTYSSSSSPAHPFHSWITTHFIASSTYSSSSSAFNSSSSPIQCKGLDLLVKGRTVDLFVVNSYGAAFQALFIFLLLPFLSKLWGIPFYQLPNYLKDGAACFLNNGTISSGCNGAPLLPLLFVIVNMGFNISLLHLIKISSAVVSCLASTVSVPISVFLFTLPLPYLGVASSLPPGFVAGAVVLLVGMLIYGSTPLLTPSSTDPQPSVD